jgi:hypothetical protein
MNSVPPFQRLSGWLAILAGPAAWSSLVLGLSVVGFDFEQFSDPAMILGLGPTAAPTLRWSFLLSLFGAYLFLVPLALWLGSTLASPTDPRLRLYTLCGLIYLILGAVGAAILSALWPSLILTYAGTAPAQQSFVLLSFTTGMTIAEDGFQGVIQNVAGGVWFVGIGALLLNRHHWLGWATLIVGIFLLISAVGGILAMEALTLIGLTATILLVPLWSIWMGIVLLRAPLSSSA